MESDLLLIGCISYAVRRVCLESAYAVQIGFVLVVKSTMYKATAGSVANYGLAILVRNRARKDGRQREGKGLF